MKAVKGLLLFGILLFTSQVTAQDVKAFPNPAWGAYSARRGYTGGPGAIVQGNTPQDYGQGGDEQIGDDGQTQDQEVGMDKLLPGTTWADAPNKVPTAAVKYKMPPGIAKLISRVASPRNGELTTVSSSQADAIEAAVVGAAVANDPENQMHAAKANQQAQASEAGNAAADVEKNQSASAIDFCASFLTNFTVEQGNRWNRLRDNLFVPMGILLLLPGALLTQMRAIIAAGSPVLGDSNPWEGIQRSIIAVFLIPGTYLVVNYSIDLSNSITYTINSEYSRLFGSDMYRDAICAQIRAFPARQPSENRNALDLQPPQMGPLLGGRTAFAKFEGSMLEGKIEDPCLGIYLAPRDRADEALTSGSVAARLGLNASNAMLATSWNILCAFQMAYLYYLWFVGPVVAGLWVWPMKQLRNALPSWVEGVVTLAFWALFWNTTILLMACFKGVDETGTIIMSALNFLATSSVKFAFDFAGLVKAAGQEAASMAEKAMKGGAKGAGGGGGGSHGGAASSGGHGKNAGAHGAARHAGLDGHHGDKPDGQHGATPKNGLMTVAARSFDDDASDDHAGDEKPRTRGLFELASFAPPSRDENREPLTINNPPLTENLDATIGNADPDAPRSGNGVLGATDLPPSADDEALIWGASFETNNDWTSNNDALFFDASVDTTAISRGLDAQVMNASFTAEGDSVLNGAVDASVFDASVINASFNDGSSTFVDSSSFDASVWNAAFNDGGTFVDSSTVDGSVLNASFSADSASFDNSVRMSQDASFSNVDQSIVNAMHDHSNDARVNASFNNFADMSVIESARAEQKQQAEAAALAHAQEAAKEAAHHSAERSLSREAINALTADSVQHLNAGDVNQNLHAASFVNADMSNQVLAMDFAAPAVDASSLINVAFDQTNIDNGQQVWGKDAAIDMSSAVDINSAVDMSSTIDMSAAVNASSIDMSSAVNASSIDMTNAAYNSNQLSQPAATVDNVNFVSTADATYNRNAIVEPLAVMNNGGIVEPISNFTGGSTIEPSQVGSFNATSGADAINVAYSSASADVAYNSAAYTSAAADAINVAYSNNTAFDQTAVSNQSQTVQGGNVDPISTPGALFRAGSEADVPSVYYAAGNNFTGSVDQQIYSQDLSVQQQQQQYQTASNFDQNYYAASSFVDAQYVQPAVQSAGQNPQVIPNEVSITSNGTQEYLAKAAPDMVVAANNSEMVVATGNSNSYTANAYSVDQSQQALAAQAASSAIAAVAFASEPQYVQTSTGGQYSQTGSELAAPATASDARFLANAEAASMTRSIGSEPQYVAAANADAVVRSFSSEPQYAAASSGDTNIQSIANHAQPSASTNTDLGINFVASQSQYVVASADDAAIQSIGAQAQYVAATDAGTTNSYSAASAQYVATTDAGTTNSYSAANAQQVATTDAGTTNSYSAANAQYVNNTDAGTAAAQYSAAQHIAQSAAGDTTNSQYMSMPALSTSEYQTTIEPYHAAPTAHAVSESSIEQRSISMPQQVVAESGAGTTNLYPHISFGHEQNIVEPAQFAAAAALSRLSVEQPSAMHAVSHPEVKEQASGFLGKMNQIVQNFEAPRTESQAEAQPSKVQRDGNTNSLGKKTLNDLVPPSMKNIDEKATQADDKKNNAVPQDKRPRTAESWFDAHLAPAGTKAPVMVAEASIDMQTESPVGATGLIPAPPRVSRLTSALRRASSTNIDAPPMSGVDNGVEI